MSGKYFFSYLQSEVGSPVYVYSAALMRANYRALKAVLPEANLCFATKANYNLAVLRLFANEGAGADTVSGGEIQRALAAGMPANTIVFSGVGKTEAEIELALRAGVHQINAESMPELRVISAVAARLGVTAPLAIRLNPDVAAATNDKIATGRKGDKFGIDHEQMMEAAALIKTLPNLNFCGIAVHIGSQIFEIANFRMAYARVADYVRELRAAVHTISRLDLGGGIGVPYKGEEAADLAAYAAAVRDTVGNLNCELTLEPGRFLVANAGVLLSRVIYVKEGSSDRFYIVDAAMNDLVRPAMYGSHHTIVPVMQPAASAALAPVHVVGPICESTDKFAAARPLPPMDAGDLLVFETAGAYGAVMSSTFNTRALIAEVLVDGDKVAVIRPAISPVEQMKWDRIPAWL